MDFINDTLTKGTPQKQIEGLVIKPQFDVSKFTPGTAIYVNAVNEKGPRYGFSRNCLVLNATPLNILAVYVPKDRNIKDVEDLDEAYIDIDIDKVASGKIEITFLGGNK